MYDNRMAASMETSLEFIVFQHTVLSTNVQVRNYTKCRLPRCREVIIQTDDSYLKIARRLDEYRTNHTQFLPVVAASPLDSRDIEPFKTDRPSEHRGFFYDPKALQRRRSSIKKVRRPNYKSNNAEAQTGSSMEQEQLEPLLKKIKSYVEELPA
ncbi:unnamed protein product [Cylicostephanus goldi]|uniref:Uncharacterized protein n=1 Tax=Cylicostephanus goldi TaxID=71465 RepID=A0A3P7MZY0_CYLGO|nr:unnamed protein product [Cylicostephanus goldi]